MNPKRLALGGSITTRPAGLSWIEIALCVVGVAVLGASIASLLVAL